MATEAGRVYFTIGADADEADKEVKRSFGDMAKSAAKLAAAIIIAKKAFDLITSTFSESIELADFADTTTGNLAAAFVRAGVDARAATDDFLKFADSMQQMTGISDETFQEMGALGASFGILGDDLKQTTLLSADMAKVMKMDVQRVMAMIARSVDSGTNAMIRYGIEMSSSSDKAVRLSSILENMNLKFGGAAQAAAASYGVRIKAMTESYGDLKEELGRSITQSETWNALLEESSKEIRKLQAALTDERGWLEDWISALVSAGGAVAHVFIAVGEAGSKAFLGLKAAGELVMAGLVGWNAIPPLIQIAFGKMAEAIINHFMGIAEAALALPGPLRDAAAQAVGQLALLQANVAMNEEAAKQAVKAVREESDAWVDAATDTAVAIEDIGANADQARGRVDRFVDAVRDAAAVIVVDPIEGALAGKKGAGGGPAGGAGDEGTTFEEAYQAQLAGFNLLADAYEKDRADFEAAQAAKLQATMQVAQQIGQAFGAAFAGMADGSMTATDAFKAMGSSMLGIIEQVATRAIMAAAAKAAAEGASSQAGIPVIGPFLAVGAASAMFALARSYLATFHEGGIVGGSGREQLIVAEKDELIFPADVTRQLLSSGKRRRMEGLQPAMAGAGAGGGSTTINNFRSLMPAQDADLMRATREQERTRVKMLRRGWLEK